MDVDTKRIGDKRHDGTDANLFGARTLRDLSETNLNSPVPARGVGSA